MSASTPFNGKIGEEAARLKLPPEPVPESIGQSAMMVNAWIVGKEKFDYSKSGGREKWLEALNKVRLALLTPARVQEWKRGFTRKRAR